MTTPRRLVVVGKIKSGFTTREIIYDSTYPWAARDNPEPDHDLIRKQQIEQKLCDS